MLGTAAYGLYSELTRPRLRLTCRPGDGVDDADAGQPRRRGRIDEEADQGESAREQQRGADEREALRAAPVEPEQHRRRHGEVKGQVGDAEQAREAGQGLNGALHVRLDEEMQRAFERDEPVGMTVGFRRVRADEATGELVEPVQGENTRCLHAERMPHGQPATESANSAETRRADRRSGHAAFPSSSATG
jgi:hypothetical protein